VESGVVRGAGKSGRTLSILLEEGGKEAREGPSLWERNMEMCERGVVEQLGGEQGKEIP
jgi:hypothetical protein